MTIVDRTVEPFGLVIGDLRINLNVPQPSTNSDGFSRNFLWSGRAASLKIVSAQRPTPIADPVVDLA